MNRSPLYYPLSRGGDFEAGGAADLQTDIMRFMAILALCLVAIFALVQSIPLEPTSSTAPQPARVAPSRQIETPEGVPEPLRRQSLTPPTGTLALRDSIARGEPRSEREPLTEIRSDPFSAPEPAPGSRAGPQATAEMQSTPVAEATPAPRSELATRPLAQVLTDTPRPAPAAPGSAPAPAKLPAPELSSAPEAASAGASPRPPETAAAATGAPPAKPAAPSPARAGFTLRFDSDTALTRLVARNEIGLYAIGEKRALRMSASRGSVSFWPASAPSQFHEMEPATVPAEVVAALHRSGAMGLDDDVKWGVTLPSRMRQQLDRYLTEQTAGALVIEGDGNLRLDP
jgi:hypothetical protein